jgi:hypothetical protein
MVIDARPQELEDNSVDTCRGFLELIDVYLPPDQVAAWTASQRREAIEHVISVITPWMNPLPRPEFLP